MLKAEQIPDAVIDVAVAMRDRGGSMSDIIRTALNAWPGAEYVFRQPHRRAVSYSKPAIILPLPQEKQNG